MEKAEKPSYINYSDTVNAFFFFFFFFLNTQKKREI